MGRIGKLCYAGLFFTPFMGCAQIDHASHGLVRPPGALPGALGSGCRPGGEMTFPLRLLRRLPFGVLPVQPYPGGKRSGIRLSGKAACAAGTVQFPSM